MLKKILSSFILAFSNIRSHFFHTFLSVIGIVIGVASLVSILSMIDGMEQFARDQISSTTSLKTIIIRSDVVKQINGITIRKDSVTIITAADLKKLRASLKQPAHTYLFISQAKEIFLKGDTAKIAGYVTATVSLGPEQKVLHGRGLDNDDIELASPVAVVGESLAKKIMQQTSLKKLVGMAIAIGGREFSVVGIVSDGKGRGSELYVPLTVYPSRELTRNPPQCLIEAENVEDVPTLKAQASDFLNRRFGGRHDFVLMTNDKRVEQAAKGFKLFRIIMGMIVGISVLVGGIGVMNVLLISVTERTAEIGVRKAVGANKRDIIFQFLSESITISMFGSFVGLIVGMAGTMAFVPIVRSITELPFQAAYTWNTLFVIAILAVVVGIVFGTYPAMRAARLDPVEAIRRE